MLLSLSFTSLKISPKCGSKEGPPWRKGLPDKWFIHCRGGFFKVSFSFWNVGNWFSCLLKDHHKTRNWRAELIMLEIFNEHGKNVIPEVWDLRRRSHSSRLSFSFPASWRAEAASLTNVQPWSDSWSADRAGSHLKLHWQTGKSRGDWTYFLRKGNKALCSWWAVSRG